METKPQFEVKVMSNEMLKPSSQSQSDHPKTYSLSFLDQHSPAIYTPCLLFYTNSNSTINSITPTKLKHSLAETLSRFYPFAGRFESESSSVVSCNDEGIPFLQTQVNCHLSEVLSSPHKVSLLNDFLPTKYCKAFESRPISEAVPLAFQVNEFQCGGVVIGCYFYHILMDAASIGTFLKYWSTLATNCCGVGNNIIQPDFNAAAAMFPPSKKTKAAPPLDNVRRYISMLMSDTSFHVVAKRFVFSNLAISKLRAIATSEDLRAPTKFEAVAGFIWEHALDAARTVGAFIPSRRGNVPNTGLSFVANIRGRTDPPLPKGSIGNMRRAITARADDGVGYQQLVAEIHAATSTVKTKVSSFLAKERTHEEGLSFEEWNLGEDEFWGYKPGFYKLTSWCQLGFDIDFGLGKPKWIVATNGELLQLSRNFIMFTDNFDQDLGGDGIEAWLFLDVKEMDILASNARFLAFVSPN